MAAIDKTYITSWSQIQETIDWASSIGDIIDDFGNKLNPMWWLADWTKEYFDEWAAEFIKRNETVNIPMWVTPTYFDIWLIRNCPIDFIQERLKDVYGDDYDKIKNHTSAYDTYVRNVGAHYSVSQTKYKYRFKDDQLVWWISADRMCYNKHTDEWKDMYLEPSPYTSSHCIIRCNLTKSKLTRMVKKWKLPVGTKLHFSGDYKRHIMKSFEITIKK